MKALHLGGLSQHNIICRICSARFPGRIPPYAGQSSIFLRKYTTAEKIDKRYSIVIAMAKVGKVLRYANVLLGG